MILAIQGDSIRWRDIKNALIGIGAKDTPLMKTCDDPNSIYFFGWVG